MWKAALKMVLEENMIIRQVVQAFHVIKKKNVD